MIEKILSEKEYSNIQVQVPCESKTPFLSQKKTVSLIAKCRFVILLLLMMVLGTTMTWAQPVEITTAEEVASEMVNAIEDNNWTPVVKAVQASEQLLQATLDGDEEAVAQGVDAAHDEGG